MKRIRNLGHRSLGTLKNASYILKQLSKHRKNSLFVKNLAVIMCMLMVLLCIFSASFYLKTQENINKEIEKSNENMLERVSDMGNDVLKTCETIATNISIQNCTKQYAFSAADEQPSEQVKSEMESLLQRYTYVYDYIDSIYLSAKSKNIIFDGHEFIERDVFYDKDFLQEVWSAGDVKYIARKKKNIYPNLITIVRPVTFNGTLSSNSDKNNVYGLVCVNINAERIGKLIEKQKNVRPGVPGVFVIGEDGRVLYSSDEELMGKSKNSIDYLKTVSFADEIQTRHIDYMESSYILSCYKSNYKNLCYVSVDTATDRHSIFQKTVKYILGAMILALIACILTALFLTYTSYKPIMSITKVFGDDIEDGISQSDMLNETSGEMKFILDNIQKNLREKKQTEDTLHERVGMLRRAMFTALQVQINPHFIYNTLENINWIAVRKCGMNNEISASVIKLSKLMRYSLETKGYLVNIGNELEYAYQYVQLLKVRYPDIFEVDWEVDEAVLQGKIIRMTLQPLLENAITHGIRPKKSKGLIEIRAEKTDDNVTISVIDDGVGMDQKDIDELNNSLSNEYLLESGHIGVRNVNQRIKIVFGEQYGIVISRRKDSRQGLCVKVSMPYSHTELI